MTQNSPGASCISKLYLTSWQTRMSHGRARYTTKALAKIIGPWIADSMSVTLLVSPAVESSDCAGAYLVPTFRNQKTHAITSDLRHIVISGN